MPLDLTQLPSLLSLPCVIDDTVPLTEKAIFTTAKFVDDNVYILTIHEGETLSDYLRRIYNNDGPYDMDCTVFAQLASKVLSAQWPINGGKIILCTGAKLGGFMIWSEKIPEMGYIGINDREVNNTVAKTTTSSKGQWCIRVSPNEYLGLSSDGPRTFTLEMWVESLRTGLINYSEISQRDMFTVDYNTVLRNLLHCYGKLGKFDQWAFFIGQKDRSVTAKWTENGVIVTEPPKDRSVTADCTENGVIAIEPPKDRDSWMTKPYKMEWFQRGRAFEQLCQETYKMGMTSHKTPLLTATPMSNSPKDVKDIVSLFSPRLGASISKPIYGDEQPLPIVSITKQVKTTFEEALMRKVIYDRNEQKRKQRKNTSKYVSSPVTIVKKTSHR